MNPNLEKSKKFHWAALLCAILITLAAALPAAAQAHQEQQIHAVVEEFLKLEFDGKDNTRLMRDDLVHYTKNKLQELNKIDSLFQKRVQAPKEGKIFIARSYHVGKTLIEGNEAVTTVTFDTISSTDTPPKYFGYKLEKKSESLIAKIKTTKLHHKWKVTNYTEPAVYSIQAALHKFGLEANRYVNTKEALKNNPDYPGGELPPHLQQMYDSVLEVINFLQSIDAPPALETPPQ